MRGGHDAALLTIPYLKVLLIVWFHKTFKLISLKQPSWPKNRELVWVPFLGNFFILLEQQFCGTLVKSCLLECATVFPIKNKVFTQHLVNRLFCFDLVLPFYFLKLNGFFQPFYQPSRH